MRHDQAKYSKLSGRGKLQAHVDKVVILKGGGEFLVRYEGRVEDRKITLEPGDLVILGSYIQFEIFDKLLPTNGTETQKRNTPLAINEQTLEWIQLGLGLGGILMSVSYTHLTLPTIYSV